MENKMQKQLDTGATNSLPSMVVKKLDEAGIPHDTLIFYQNNRWVYKRRLSISDDNQLSSQPLDSLGPFGIHSVDVTFILYPETHTYKINKIGKRELNDDEQATGSFAPIAEITLEGFARSTAYIPDDATHFCWLYPPSINRVNNTLDLSNEHEENLLKIGGYAYFHLDQNNDSNNNNNSFRLLRVNSLFLPSREGLTFVGPHQWHKEFTKNLWEQNRFHPVTLSCLLQKGAQYFAFINPYEFITDEDGHSSWKPSDHGAFVYLFNKDHSPHKLDCYFSITDDCLGVAPSDGL